MKRTTHRSSRGTKLYAVRRKGRFTDIQRYRRAHSSDMRKLSNAERAKITERKYAVTLTRSGATVTLQMRLKGRGLTKAQFTELAKQVVLEARTITASNNL